VEALSCATPGGSRCSLSPPRASSMKKGRSESAALTGVDRGPATSRELHSFLECCEEDFQALLTPTRQGAPSARKMGDL
jgi:hypothetical protein